MNDLSQQVLPKAPRLLPDGTGYDWREFDRWLQRIQTLLGSGGNSKSLNVFTEIADQAALFMSGGNSTSTVPVSNSVDEAQVIMQGGSTVSTAESIDAFTLLWMGV